MLAICVCKWTWQDSLTAYCSVSDGCVVKSRQMNSEQLESVVASYQLRFFTPRELANLLCFPPHFGLYIISLSLSQF